MEELAKKAAELIVDGDIGEVTIKEYLKALLSKVWEDEEGFSGKRPFGNSGWQYHVYEPMVKSGIVNGTLDTDGYIVDFDQKQAGAIIQAIIKSF